MFQKEGKIIDKERVQHVIQERLRKTQPILVNGDWIPSKATSIIYNPSTGEEITQASVASKEEIDRVVQHAKISFNGGNWSAIPSSKKAQILWRIAELIERNSHELATLEVLNVGKRHHDVLSGDVPFAAECFRYYAGWCTKIEGSQISSLDAYGYHVYTKFEPIGVAGIIIPWNAPLTQAALKLAPALASGCSCILKPAEEAPLSVSKLVELVLEAGVHKGAIQVLLGGREVGEALVQHQDVDKISFTGSSKAGKLVVRAAAQNLKKVSLELGGKSPAVIFSDADLGEAVPGVAHSIFANAGQACIAGSRLYVHQEAYQRVVRGLTYLASNMSREKENINSIINPIITSEHRERISTMVTGAEAQGAKVEVGGQDIPRKGFYFEPTILTQTTSDMNIVKEEVFGPVLVIMPFESEDEVIDFMNDSSYGLAASLWTTNFSRAHRFSSRIRAGLVGINCHGVADVSVPFGGYKQSGWGRENGFEAIRQFTELKSVVAKL